MQFTKITPVSPPKHFPGWPVSSNFTSITQMPSYTQEIPSSTQELPPDLVKSQKQEQFLETNFIDVKKEIKKLEENSKQ